LLRRSRRYKLKGDEAAHRGVPSVRRFLPGPCCVVISKYNFMLMIG
jgi:hypothetical protein